MTKEEKAIREFCGRYAEWWPSTTQVQEMLALAQPELFKKGTREMNANELADRLDKISYDCTIEEWRASPVGEAATKLRQQQESGMKNIAFLRTRIELIDCFFEEKEVDEIWVTFPDPHPKRIRENKRLTSPPFLKIYKKMLKDDGIVHLKTDASSLYQYTLEVIEKHKHHILISTDNLYNSGITEDVMGIQTFYEKMFLAEGKHINYCKFQLK